VGLRLRAGGERLGDEAGAEEEKGECKVSR